MLNFAAAAAYPAPFTSNSAIVVGANAASSDNIAASEIAANPEASNTDSSVTGPSSSGCALLEVPLNGSVIKDKSSYETVIGCKYSEDKLANIKDIGDLGGDIFSAIQGCWSMGKVYPIGHVKDGQYCGFHYEETITGKTKKEIMFISQSFYGENCTYNYECESDFCYDKKCGISERRLISQLNDRISQLEIELSELKEAQSNSLIEIQEEKTITGNTIKEESLHENNFLEKVLNIFKKK